MQAFLLPVGYRLLIIASTRLEWLDQGDPWSNLGIEFRRKNLAVESQEEWHESDSWSQWLRYQVENDQYCFDTQCSNGLRVSLLPLVDSLFDSDALARAAAAPNRQAP